MPHNEDFKKILSSFPNTYLYEVRVSYILKPLQVQEIDAEADIRIHVFLKTPNKEICKTAKQCHSFHSIFLEIVFFPHKMLCTLASNGFVIFK